MSILRRYIVREFLLILLAALAGFLMLTLVGDAAERLNDFIDAGAPWRLVALFYLNQVPHYLMFTLPASSLIATLFTLGQMSKHNEITAMLSSGISLRRIFFPLFGVMLVVAAAAFIVDETLVPAANTRRSEILDYQIRGRSRPVEEIRENIDYLGEQGRRWVARSFDSRTGTLEQVRLLAFTGGTEELRMEYRIDAERAVYEQGEGWRFVRGTARYFRPGTWSEHTAAFDSLLIAGLRERPADFLIRVVDPEHMSFRQLRAVIAHKRRNGIETAVDETELWFKTALPATNFIIVLFGAPLAVLRRKTGPGVGIAMGIMAYMFFMSSYYLTRSLGYSGAVDPLAAAWSSNLAFAAAGLGLHLRVRR